VQEKLSTEPRINLTHLILTLIGTTGLVLFILACRPSWSPDGKKVLYSYWDEGAQKSAVVLFDRKTRTSRVIFECSNPTKKSEEILAAQWTKDGARAIVVIPGGDGGIQILALPQNGQKPLRAFEIRKIGQAEDLAYFPLPQAGDQVFVTGADTRVRVNLETGEIYRKDDIEEKESLLYEAGGRVQYMRGIEAEETGEKEGEQAKKETDGQKQQDGPVAYEFGKLDEKDLSLHPTVTLRTEELKSKGIGGLTGFLDVELHNLKFAVAEDSDASETPKIVVIAKDGIEQTLNVGIKGKPYKIGNPQWSRDGKTIFVSALISDEKTKRTEFAVVEVPVDGSSTRLDRVDERPDEEMGNDYLAYVQIALSPDGKLIAAATGDLGNVKPERKGLFLLDLSKPNRPVNFYPAPTLPALPTAKKE